MILAPAQVKELRNEVNAAHAVGDAGRAQAAQAKLHAHFVADSDAFFKAKKAAHGWCAKMHKYYALQRGTGNRWIAVAAIVYQEGAATCIARAERDLQAFGVSLTRRRVTDARRAETQKNWGGQVDQMPTYAAGDTE